MRRAARVDSNHAEIVQTFRKLGWSVLDISQLKNCADLVVSKGGLTYVIEIKNGLLFPSARKLTEGEDKFRKEWKGHYAIIESVGDVLMLESTNFGSTH